MTGSLRHSTWLTIRRLLPGYDPARDPEVLDAKARILASGPEPMPPDAVAAILLDQAEKNYADTIQASAEVESRRASLANVLVAVLGAASGAIALTGLGDHVSFLAAMAVAWVATLLLIAAGQPKTVSALNSTRELLSVTAGGDESQTRITIALSFDATAAGLQAVNRSRAWAVRMASWLILLALAIAIAGGVVGLRHRITAPQTDAPVSLPAPGVPSTAAAG